MGQPNCYTGTNGILWTKVESPFPYRGVVLQSNPPPNWPPASALYAQLADPCTSATSAGSSSAG